MPAVPLLGQPGQEGPEPTIFPDNQDAWAELSRLRGGNAELARQLATLSIGLDPMLVIQTRLATILDTLLPPSTPEGQRGQIFVELNFENAMGQILAEARRGAVTSQLQAGAHVPPYMLEQMARASGQHVPPGLNRRR